MSISEADGSKGPLVPSGRIWINKQEGRIEVFDENNELIAEIGKLSAPAAGEPEYAIKLYKDSSMLVGENGTVRVGDNLTIFNNRIILNDGENDRMLIGFQAGGF